MSKPLTFWEFIKQKWGNSITVCDLNEFKLNAAATDYSKYMSKLEWSQFAKDIEHISGKPCMETKFRDKLGADNG